MKNANQNVKSKVGKFDHVKATDTPATNIVVERIMNAIIDGRFSEAPSAGYTAVDRFQAQDTTFIQIGAYLPAFEEVYVHPDVRSMLATLGIRADDLYGLILNASDEVGDDGIRYGTKEVDLYQDLLDGRRVLRHPRARYVYAHIDVVYGAIHVLLYSHIIDRAAKAAKGGRHAA